MASVIRLRCNHLEQILLFVNLIALGNIGRHDDIVFCCLLAVFFVVTFFLFPETKGYSLEEIAEVLDGQSATAHVQNATAIEAGKAENDSDFLKSETAQQEELAKY